MEEEENYSLQTEPTWEHKALSGTDSILCARCKSILWEAPEKGAYHQRRDSSKRIEPGKVRFCFWPLFNVTSLTCHELLCRLKWLVSFCHSFSQIHVYSAANRSLFLVCEQLLKGIVYPLAVKSTQVLDLAHQKAGVVRSSSLPLQARFHSLSL